MKKHISTILLVLVLLLGFSLLLYPTISNWLNTYYQSQAIVDYSQMVSELDRAMYEAARADAQAYNDALRQNPSRFHMSEDDRTLYLSLLDTAQNGIMGYVEIPRIDCRLPIYHTTEESVLQVGIGHIEGSSLPVGGAGTHCAISGHRGLPSAKLFTNLDKLEMGDRFMLHVLDDVLTYEVDQILVVEPDEMDALAIDPEKDYCTLVTCTPYGINSHRLLVRGHRVAAES